MGWLAGCTAAAFASWSAVGVYYRPTPDFTAEGKPAPRPRSRHLNLAHEPIPLLISRSLTMALGTAVSKAVINVLNTLEIVDNVHYRNWLSSIRMRPAGIPLITVANHETCMDDPGLMGGLVPWDVACNPKKMRWGICEQSLCFGRNAFRQGFGGLGQALPIWRGGGIDQPLLLDAGRRVANGDWLHVFPEGRVVQNGRGLGLDDITRRGPAELSAVGRLKWGVGKLIAHSPEPPAVIPMHHCGMAAVLPQHAVWRDDGPAGARRFDNSVKSWVPRRGNRVTVEFGPPVVDCARLVGDYERRHGPLRKVSAAGGAAWDADFEW